MGIEFSLRRFKFTLESVLVVRNKALEDERIKLASILRVYNNQKEALDKLFSEVETIKSEINKSFENNDFNPQIISNYNSYLYKLSQDIEAQKEVLSKIEQDIEKQQEVLKDAYIKVKSLEVLKDKQKEQYLKEQQYEEIKELDDIVNSRTIA
ncbi:MAG: flagellar export protein FliJ [Candidatus Gastranaerophilales bacterium]|nr:flagellar export protein FliJ [Candidatus Gastranaerophilales bacterium]